MCALKSIRAVAAVIGLVFAGGVVRAAGNFQIVINPDAGLAANPDALAAFDRAANEWSSQITSAFPVTIQITGSLAALQTSTGAPDTNIIGQTTFTDLANANQPYDLVRNLMAARATRAGDAVLALLPTSAQVSAHVPPSYTFTPAATPTNPNPTPQQVTFAFDKQHLGILRANRKVLGILPGTDTAADGIIQFNTNFSFSYTGVATPGKMDFQTVAAHEIGHVLGFTSDVDDFDDAMSSNTSLTDDLTTLDLFRFNNTEIPSLLNFTTATRELRPGAESVTDDLTHTYAMSTGASFGDGRQASHWKDDQGFFGTGNLIGIMDPTLDFGTVETVGAADLRAMELMGYDTVPEPGSLLLIGFATVGLLARRRGMGALAARLSSPKSHECGNPHGLAILRR